MQLKGWGLTRATRIAIILLVLQSLGLGHILAVAPATTAGPNIGGSTQALIAFDTAVSRANLFETNRELSAALGEDSSSAILPDPAPLPRRLPRAPPAI
jgi:hypothetical protein